MDQVDFFYGSSGIVQPIQVSSMPADALVSYVTRSSAAMISNIRDRQVVFLEDKFQKPLAIHFAI